LDNLITLCLLYVLGSALVICYVQLYIERTLKLVTYSYVVCCVRWVCWIKGTFVFSTSV